MLSGPILLNGSASGDYYVKAANPEYYTKSLGPPGQWNGRGAVELGLQGKVEAQQLKNLLEGKSPDGAEKLVQDQKWKDRERQCGWDLTFSAPKSVSVLWSQSTPEVRATIEAAHRAAVERALRFLEREVGITRRGAGGKIREKAKLIFATFQHGTSRAQDPQLHTHALLINLCIREDGTAGTVWSKAFFETRKAGDAVYQLGLVEEIREKMNLAITLNKTGFHIESVSPEVCRMFSKRRQDIEKVLEREGNHSARNSERVAILTRPSKQERPANQLFTEWQREGQAHGWGPKEARKLVEEAHRRRPKAKTAREREKETKLAREAAEERMATLLKRAEDKNAKDNPFAKKETPGQKKPYFRFESRFLFPRAPEWSPFKNWTIPILISGEKKSKNWWGKVRRKIETPLGQLQWRDKYLFPNAPEWSPLKHVAIPRIVLRQNTEWKWRENVWKKNTTFGQLQLRQKALFPRAAEGSLAHKLALPAFRLQTKRPDFKLKEVTQHKHSY